MAEGERKRLRKRSAFARLPAHTVCFSGSDWQGNTNSWKLTLGTAGKFTLPCIQVALVCRAMPALFGPLKTHGFTLPGFTLRTCSTLPLLKRTFSRQSLARKKNLFCSLPMCVPNSLLRKCQLPGEQEDQLKQRVRQGCP